MFVGSLFHILPIHDAVLPRILGTSDTAPPTISAHTQIAFCTNHCLLASLPKPFSSSRFCITKFIASSRFLHLSFWSFRNFTSFSENHLFIRFCSACTLSFAGCIYFGCIPPPLCPLIAGLLETELKRLLVQGMFHCDSMFEKRLNIVYKLSQSNW